MAWVMAVGFLTVMFNMIMEGKKMPCELRKSVLVPGFKNEGDVHIYRGKNPISHSIKLWERTLEARLRNEVVFIDQYY